MSEPTDILMRVRQSAIKRMLFLPHAVRQMSQVGKQLSKKEIIMKCMYCQGKMNKDTAPFHIDRKFYHLTLDTVPAWVCQLCGEVYFDELEVDSIQEIIRIVEERTKKLSVAA